MSLDSSLKSRGGHAKHRNVLSRAERVAKLAADGKFDMENDSPVGLVKVANRKMVAAGRANKKKTETEEEK